MKQAEALLAEMENEGISLRIETFETMIDGYASICNETLCLDFFKRLKVKEFMCF